MTTSTKSSKSTTVKAPKAVKAKGFENPFRKGCYGAIIDTLVSMGANKHHDYAGFAAQLKKGWEGYGDWASKDKVNKKTGLDPAAKLLQNCKVIQRPDYGAPLHDQNACLDMGLADGKMWIALNTKSNSPLKASGRTSKPQTEKTAQKPTPKIAKAGKAPSKSAAPILTGADAIAFLKAGKKKAK